MNRRSAWSLPLALALVLNLAACGGGTAQSTPEPEETRVAGNEYVTIDGICVDDSYRDDEDSPIRMVYLFYTVTAGEENLKVDSIYTDLTINDANTYQSEHYADSAAAARYAKSYYYSSYIEDVYVGESVKVMATFYIPEGDLAPGRTITLSDDQMPGCESFLLSTDDVRHFESGEAMARAMDPEGYDQALLAYEEADPETADLVKSLINGYYWSCYVNMTAYELEFWAEDNFEVRSSLGTSATGTYTVRNGYIFCTYPDTGYTVEVPYELVDGEIDLDMIAAFDVKG